MKCVEHLVECTRGACLKSDVTLNAQQKWMSSFLHATLNN
jgi:hypothetical protein